MKIYNQWRLGVVLYLWVTTLLVACVPKQEETPNGNQQLKLSSTELTLSSELSVSKVVVDAPAGGWDAFLASAETGWLKLEPQGQELVVTALPNLEAKARRAKIVVVASGVSGHITVQQSAAQPVLDADTGEVMLEAGAGTKTLRIRTNDSRMEVDAQPTDWLHLQVAPSSGFLIVRYDSNLKDVTRTAEVQIRFSDGSSSSIKFTQAPQLTYFLPFEGDRKNLDFMQFIQYERSRGFALSRAQQAAPSQWFSTTPDWLEFNTFSSALPSIVYTRDYEYKYAGRLPYATSRLEVSDVRELERGKGYRQWLMDLGYRELYGSTDTEPVLESQDQFFIVKTTYDKSAQKTFLEFYPQILQTRAYETFASFPLLDNYLRFRQADWTYEQVKAFHDSRGDERTYQVIAPATNKPGIELYKPSDMTSGLEPDRVWYEYYYLVNNPRLDTEDIRAHEGQIKSVSLCYADHNKILYNIEEGSNEYKCTREFIALAVSAGFDYQGVRSGGVAFTHRERNVDMVVMFAPKQAVYFGDDDVAVLKFTPRLIPAAASTSASEGSKTEIPAPVATARKIASFNLR